MSFQETLQDYRRAIQDATKKTYTQYLTDTLVLALNSNGWEEEEIRKLLSDWGKTYDEYFDSLRKTAETDYYRAKLDERLADICKSGDLVSFEDRYPYLSNVRGQELVEK